MYLPHGKYITAEFHIRKLLRQSILRVITRKIYISLIIGSKTQSVNTFDKNASSPSDQFALCFFESKDRPIESHHRTH